MLWHLCYPYQIGVGVAFLCNVSEGTKHYLLSHHSFGRREGATDTYIENDAVSRIHAIIEWANQHWSIRDLSRNGTWLDDMRLPKAQNIRLQTGQIIYFSSPSATGWRIDDLTPPHDCLIPLQQNDKTIQLNNYHLLPDEQQPELVIYRCTTKGAWIKEKINALNNSEPEVRPEVVLHGDLVRCRTKMWSMFLPISQKETHNTGTVAQKLEEFVFKFELSQDEEFTRLVLSDQHIDMDMQERTHHYLLAHLARKRAEDAKFGFDEASQGWVYNDLLQNELNLEMTHINILIFRAKKQLSEILNGVNGIEKIIQRRQGSMRFGYSSFTICKGGKLIYSLSPHQTETANA